nr:odorant receptor 30 [Papilio dardanus]
MENARQTDCFKMNFFFWKIFGIWPGRASNKYYKYFSIIYLFITLVIYNGILTVNLYHAPSKIDVLIREVLFYFNEIAISAKVITVLYYRKTILEVLDILDSTEFVENNEDAKLIISKDIKKYKKGWRIYAFFLNFSFFSEVFVPVITHIIWNTHLHLPISNYHFLSDEIRNRYFTFWFFYQASCMYGHMMYNVNMDSFVAGLIFFVITSIRTLECNLKDINSDSSRAEDLEGNRDTEILKLKQCLKHYELVLRLSSKVQRIISLPTFVQFGITGAIICVTLCGLLTPSASDIHLFLVTYLIGMTSRIFLPAWLGSRLTYKSQGLVLAAYNSQWITESNTFKRNIIIFMTRANISVTLNALKIFPMTLQTFISILKTAYSLFTLVRYVQNRQEE